MNILPSECSCDKCSRMCHSTCCGAIEDIKKLMDAGFANRLSFDNWPNNIKMVGPALKGYEGKESPWSTATIEGCTFWKDGLCELHDTGLKPIQGKLSLHGMSDDENNEIAKMITDSWNTEEANAVIEEWKKLNEMD